MIVRVTSPVRPASLLQLRKSIAKTVESGGSTQTRSPPDARRIRPRGGTIVPPRTGVYTAHVSSCVISEFRKSNKRRSHAAGRRL